MKNSVIGLDAEMSVQCRKKCFDAAGYDMHEAARRNEIGSSPFFLQRCFKKSRGVRHPQFFSPRPESLWNVFVRRSFSPSISEK